MVGPADPGQPSGGNVPNITWDWQVQPAAIPPYGVAYRDRLVTLFTQYLWAPKEKRCPFCADQAGNPGKVHVPDGPPDPEPKEEDEYQDIKDAVAAHDRAVTLARKPKLCESCGLEAPSDATAGDKLVPCTGCKKKVCLHCWDLHQRIGCERISVVGWSDPEWSAADDHMVEEPINELRDVADRTPGEGLLVADDLEDVEVSYEVRQGEVFRRVHVLAQEREAVFGVTV